MRSCQDWLSEQTLCDAGGGWCGCDAIADHMHEWTEACSEQGYHTRSFDAQGTMSETMKAGWKNVKSAASRVGVKTPDYGKLLDTVGDKLEHVREDKEALLKALKARAKSFCTLTKAFFCFKVASIGAGMVANPPLALFQLAQLVSLHPKNCMEFINTVVIDSITNGEGFKHKKEHIDSINELLAKLFGEEDALTIDKFMKGKVTVQDVNERVANNLGALSVLAGTPTEASEGASATKGASAAGGGKPKSGKQANRKEAAKRVSAAKRPSRKPTKKGAKGKTKAPKAAAVDKAPQAAAVDEAPQAAAAAAAAAAASTAGQYAQLASAYAAHAEASLASIAALAQ